jgi:hypothetical protein
MVMLALATRDPGVKGAEEMTGYVEGRGTWQFDMLLALAEAGLTVRDVEELDVDLFLRDPETAIRQQVEDPEVATAYIADTDLEREAAALEQCLADPRIVFECRAPSLAEASKALTASGLLLCHVNSNLLAGRPGHTGHMVVVEEVDEDGVLLHDPGPPSRWARRVLPQLFEEAWGKMPNFIAVSRAGPLLN